MADTSNTDSASSFIDTTLNYRIQNVDFLSYIELPDYPQAENSLEGRIQVEMRPFKVTAKQQWKFVEVSPDSSDKSYYIQNVAKPHLYFGCGYEKTASSYVPAVMRAESPGKCTVEFEDGSFYMYYIIDSDEHYFQTTSYSSKLEVKLQTENMDSDNLRWNLLPVSPTAINDPLAIGYYRIRSFTGSNLLTMPSDESNSGVFIKPQSASDPYQRWSVTPQANGLYLIQNSGAGTKYLGNGSVLAAQGDNIHGQDTTFEWDLRSFGSGLAWSINIPIGFHEYPSLSVGFADYHGVSNDIVSLQSSDAVPSQLWFFEKYTTLGMDKIHAKRQVEEGNYYLQSSSGSLSMSVNSTPWRITPGKASKFALAYEAGSSQFTLTYIPNPPAKPVKVADRGGYLGLAEDATPWILLEDTNVDEYYLCRPDAGYPRRIVSSRIKSDIDNNQVFAIDDMIQSEVTQRWKFVKAG